MKIRQLRLLTAILLGASVIMSGCNRNADAAAGAADEAAGAAENAPTMASDDTNNTISVSGNTVGGRQLNIIRSEYEPDTLPTPVPTVNPTPTPFPDSEDPYEAAPQFFDVEDSVEPVMGYCDVDMCDELIAALNENRASFATGNLAKNSSLCVAAEVRAKEYAVYPVYKIRPDGRPFTTVSPQGYVENEYYCIPVRNSVIPVWEARPGYWNSENFSHPTDTYSPKVIVEGLMEIREARNIMMHPEYTQVGAVWFVNGNFVIAGFTFSY
ncbi:MAG: hypothetical protein IJT37_08705 [Lachnospiraceae bacterium]|nr:hypothetical protein [Lachnospiraceae bacterium]